MEFEAVLERVQFKFASIIGELCSQPVVLSQFAVWVDLRLAEYKLKGSFSLDCSGETPDPGWMKGIKSALLAQKLLLAASANQNVSKPSGHGYAGSPSRVGGQSRRSPMPRPPRAPAPQRQIVRLDEEGDRIQSSMHNVNTSQSQEPIRLSPDIVIKEEHETLSGADEVYPISLHMHEQDNGQTRKRTATESAASDSSETSPSKLRRTSSSQQDINPSNESLMSIIGLGGDNSQDDADDSVDNINSDIDFIMAAEIAQNTNQELNSSSSSTMAGQSFEETPGPSGSHEGAVSRNAGERMFGASRNPVNWSSAYNRGSYQTSPEQKSYRNIGSSPITTTSQTDTHVPPAATEKKLKFRKIQTRCYVNKFESWLRVNFPEELCPIEEITPEVLDSYLAQFFTNVTSHFGEYGYNSLRAIRSGLERHLRENNYPHSITSSVPFSRSQGAFKRRSLAMKHQKRA